MPIIVLLLAAHTLRLSFEAPAAAEAAAAPTTSAAGVEAGVETGATATMSAAGRIQTLSCCFKSCESFGLYLCESGTRSVC